MKSIVFKQLEKENHQPSGHLVFKSLHIFFIFANKNIFFHAAVNLIEGIDVPAIEAKIAEYQWENAEQIMIAQTRKVSTKPSCTCFYMPKIGHKHSLNHLSIVYVGRRI